MNDNRLVTVTRDLTSQALRQDKVSAAVVAAETVRDMKVGSEADAVTLTGALVVLAAGEKAVREQGKIIKAPLQAATRMVDEVLAAPSRAITTAIASGKAKLLAWRQTEFLRVEMEKAREVLAARAAQAEAQEKGEDLPPADTAPLSPTRLFDSGNGVAYTTRNLKVEVVSQAEVPEYLKTVNLAEAKAEYRRRMVAGELASGEQPIAGLRFYYEEGVTVR